MPIGAMYVIILVLAGCVLLGCVWEIAKKRMDREAEDVYRMQSNRNLRKEMDRYDR